MAAKAASLVVVEMPERRNQHERLEAPGCGGEVYLRQARGAGHDPVQNEGGVQRQRQHRLLLTVVGTLSYELDGLFPVLVESRPEVGFC
jgi:hypothetical protein